MKKFSKRLCMIVFVMLLSGIGVCAQAKTKKIDASFYTVKLTDSMQKKYHAIFTDYAASHYLIFYDKKAYDRGERVEKFRFVVSMDYPSAANVVVKGKITPAWKYGGIFSIMYGSSLSNKKTVKKDAEKIYKKVKIKSAYKFTPVNKKKFTKVKQALYEFLISEQIDQEGFSVADTFPKLYLIYLNNDSDPELLMVSDTVYAGEVLISSYKGKLKYSRLEYGEVKFRKKKNRLYLAAGRMGYYSDTVYKLSKGKLKAVKTGNWQSYDATFENAYDLKWDDTYVSAAKYRKNLKKAFPVSKASKFPKARDKYAMLHYLMFGTDKVS